MSDGTRDASARPAHDSLHWLLLAMVLLSFLVLTHVSVMLAFLFRMPVSAAAAPAALLAALAAGEWLARREHVSARLRLAVPAAALSVIGVSMALASWFFDMSWDGLWYHQTAVYQMAHGWNPLFDPMHTFVPHLQDWLRHYAKGPWYIALGLYATTGSIEMAKAAPWIALAAAFSAVYAALREYGFRRMTGMTIAVLVVINPVVVFELASYLVDGLMISYMACFVAGGLLWLKRPGIPAYWLTGISAVLCINAKFTGLVYLCFAAAGLALYILHSRRDLMVRFVLFQTVVIAAGVLLFGFNPYVTNTLYRHNPFYPMLGSADYPSLARQGEDPIERWETPDNMKGQSRFIRLGYALFGRPGAPPYYPGNNASLMLPFDVGRSDFAIYYFHDVRISGFGPLFSGAFILGIMLIGISLIRPGIPRVAVILTAVTVLSSLLVSEHTWWARYGPQLWWIPLLGIAAGLTGVRGKLVRGGAACLAAVLVLNVMPIAVVHFMWEVDATRTTHEQLAWLRGKEGIQVDMQYFGEPFGERMKNAGITFTRTDTLRCGTPMELMSVSPGYPCAVRVCLNR